MNAPPIFSSRSLLWFPLYSGLLVASPAGPTPTPQQREIIAEHRRMAGVRMKAMEEYVATLGEDIALLNQGDLTPLGKAAANKDVKRLAYFFQDTANRGFHPPRAPLGDPGMDPQKRNAVKDRIADDEKFNQRIREGAREALASIPGHTAHWVNQVEEACRDPRIGPEVREYALLQLGELGTMEAIQALGNYLEDKRHPEEAYKDSGKALPRELKSRPNFFRACGLLQRALGEAAPLRDETGKRAKREDEVEGNDFEAIQAWWKSDAAKPYREWKFETHEPMPPPRLRAKPLAAVQPPSAAGKKDAPGQTATSTEGPVWIVLAILAGGVVLAVALAARRRG